MKPEDYQQLIQDLQAIAEETPDACNFEDDTPEVYDFSEEFNLWEDR